MDFDRLVFFVALSAGEITNVLLRNRKCKVVWDNDESTMTSSGSKSQACYTMITQQLRRPYSNVELEKY